MTRRKKISYFLLGTLVLIFFSGVYMNAMIDQIYGGKTEEVKSEKFLRPVKKIVFTDANILSPDGLQFLYKHNIYVENGVISLIDSNKLVKPGYKIINASHKFIIPGLIDSHVHLFRSPNDLLLYLVNGVTHIREMIGTPLHLKWRKEIEEGRRLGPDLYIASPRLGSFGFWGSLWMEHTQGFRSINSEKEAINMITDFHEKGFDGIKIYSHLSHPAYKSVTETAQKLDMDVVGHIPFDVNISEVASGQQREIAHFEEIMNAINREFGYYSNNQKDAFFRYIENRIDSIAHQLKLHNVSVTSTLWGMATIVQQKTELVNELKNVHLKYVNPGISEGHKFIKQGGLGWLPYRSRVRYPENLTPEETKGRTEYWEIYSEACLLVGKLLNEREVNILAGTDANLSIKVPGFSLHDELIMLKEIGMNPSKILQSSTSKPSEWMGLKKGKLKEGFEADLLLLDNNPLENIENIKSIYGILKNGNYIDKVEREEILKSVVDANNKSRNQSIDKYIQ